MTVDDESRHWTRTGRRTFLKAVLALPVALSVNSSAHAASDGVRLLLLREPGYRNATGQVNSCVRCIPGKLYGVPEHINWDRDLFIKHGLGLDFLTDTVELSYNENMRYISSIPLGTYRAFVREDATKSWMWTGRQQGKGSVDLDRAWRIQLHDVPDGRTAIQFHYGNDVKWSQGCIIVGINTRNICQADACRFSDSPAKAVRQIREYVSSRIRSSSQELMVRIDDRV